MRAISGMQLAAEILSYMNSTIKSGTAGSSSNKFGIQFGAYATFMSFFGLVGLDTVSENFKGVADYASSMAFELFTDADVDAWPATEDLQVRFLFHNGTASNSSEPQVYPLFGSDANATSWTTFHDKLNDFAIGTTEQWCHKCGNSTGTCAPYAGSNDNGAGSASAQSSEGGNGISPTIGGVIGAFVTLAVVLGSLALFMLVGGFRLVSKKALAARGGAVQQGVETKA